MPDREEALTHRCPIEDEIDSACAPFFDSHLGAWVLSTHADLRAAFQEARLAPASGDSQLLGEAGPSRMRAEVREALPPRRMQEWREQLCSDADSFLSHLSAGEPVEMMTRYARPLCLRLAANVTGISLELAEQLRDPAQLVSMATAAAGEGVSREQAEAANARLRECFPPGPESLRDSGFVGLSQTLPCLLANAWHALVRHPDQWRFLHLHPEGLDQAIEELLRYAGTVRIVKRTATADLELNGLRIRKGERVILRIEAANRDPQRFDHARELHCARPDTGHFTFGAGSHSCVGANLIRMAMKAITAPLLRRFAAGRLVRPVDWRGRSVFRFPGSLWLRFELE
jgi:cytochrome P450